MHCFKLSWAMCLCCLNSLWMIESVSWICRLWEVEADAARELQQRALPCRSVLFQKEMLVRTYCLGSASLVNKCSAVLQYPQGNLQFALKRCLWEQVICPRLCSKLSGNLNLVLFRPGSTNVKRTTFTGSVQVAWRCWPEVHVLFFSMYHHIKKNKNIMG